MNELEKVLNIAEKEVGYLEKETNNYLYEKTTNAGNKNFTKYAKDLDDITNFYNTKKNGFAWCDVFIDWCFVQAVGKDRALDLLCQTEGSCGAGCSFSMKYYKNKNQFFTEPKIGDQIFFKSGKEISHTGLVYNIDENNVYTIEGNTSSAEGVVSNGGAVEKKSYLLNSKCIAGYGRPNYNVEGEVVIEQVNEKVYSTIKKGSKGELVIECQDKLIAKGYSLPKYGVDASFGAETENAVKELQRDAGIEVDGIVGPVTWGVLNGNFVRTTKIVIAKSGLNVRENMGLDSNVIAVVPFSCSVNLIENVGAKDDLNWSKIEYQNTIGYVANKYLQ